MVSPAAARLTAEKRGSPKSACALREKPTPVAHAGEKSMSIIKTLTLSITSRAPHSEDTDDGRGGAERTRPTHA